MDMQVPVQREDIRSQRPRRNQRDYRSSPRYSANLAEVVERGGRFQAHGHMGRVRGKIYFEDRGGKRWMSIQVHDYSDERRTMVYEKDKPLTLNLDGDRTETVSEKLYLSFARLFGRSKWPGFYPEKERLAKKYNEEVADAIIDILVEMEQVFSGACMGDAYCPRSPRQPAH